MRISLGEGNTPLVRSRWIGQSLGLKELYFKLEQTNPTGSYKDRFAAQLVSLLVAGGHELCLGTSSGNAGAAMAAYSAAAGITCVLCVPENAPAAKLTQIQAYGARLLRVRGMVDSAVTLRALFERLQDIARRSGMPLGVSAFALSPEAMAGIEPLGEELVAQLGAPPGHVFVPVGSGGCLIATWNGLRSAGRSSGHSAGHNTERPAERTEGAPGDRVVSKVYAVQADGNDTLVSAFRAGETQAREVTAQVPPARISGLGVPIDLDATRALQAVRESGGGAYVVEDERVWETQTQLAQREGLYVEPAGAVSVAGLCHAVQDGRIAPHERVVCLLTGHGFKDGDAARRMADRRGTSGGDDLTISPEELDEALLKRLSDRA